MDDNQVVDQLTEGITPFQPEAQAITEVVTPTPEFTSAPVITPAEVANINQANEHQELTAESKLGEIAVTQAEQDQQETALLMQQAPALKTYGELRTMLDKCKRFKRQAAVLAGLTVAVGSSLAQHQLGLHGVAESMAALGPSGVMGILAGSHLEPVTAAVGQVADVESMSPGKKMGLKAADMVVGGAAGVALTMGGDKVAEQLKQPLIGLGSRLADDAIAPVGVAAHKAIKVVRNTVATPK